MNLVNQSRLGLRLFHIPRTLKFVTIVIIFSIIVINMIYKPQSYMVENFQSYDDQVKSYDTSNHADLPMHRKNIKYFAVDNPLCRIPEFNPNDESIRKYLVQENLKICSKLAPLTSVTFNPKTKKHTLKVNERMVGQYLTNDSSLKCCFSVFTKSYYHGIHYENEDERNRYRGHKRRCFKHKIDLPKKAEYIYVYCNSKDERIFQMVYFLVVDKKPKAVPSQVKTDKKKYSLFMFAIDSVSRMNFIRTLPKTRKYIESRGWLPLEGYVKVGENTFPNAVPIFTGMNVGQLKSLCYPHKYYRFDDCPFIWKNFSENGYLTSYCEDQTWMSTFNHEKYGFMNSPTDYYSRPMSRIAETLLGREEGDDFCLGPEPEIEPFFRFNAEFLRRFQDRPYFNILWTNSFSHNNMNRPKIMDVRVRAFLQNIEPHLNSTVVILFSDHGCREDDFRSTYLGWQEDRTPFIYFYLPPSLRASHPHWYRNLQANRNKLTSPFDLHATLLELLFNQTPLAPAACPKCGSLFAPVQKNRACADAGIDSKYCPCWTANNFSSGFEPPRYAPSFSILNNS